MFFASEIEIRASAAGRYRLRGKFPYNSVAVLSDGGTKGGRPQKELFKSRAFQFSVNQFNSILQKLAANPAQAKSVLQKLQDTRPADVQAAMDEAHAILTAQGNHAAASLIDKSGGTDGDIYLLHGHDFSQPLANGSTGTLVFADTDPALFLSAEILDQIAQTSYGADLIRQIMSGLSVGLSPGFRLPPPRAVAKAEEITQEPMNPAAGQHGAIIRTIIEAILFELSIVTRPAYKAAAVAIEQRSVSGPYAKATYSLLRYR